MTNAARQVMNGCVFRLVLTAVVVVVPLTLLGITGVFGLSFAGLLAAMVPKSMRPLTTAVSLFGSGGLALAVFLGPVFLWRLWFERSAFRRFGALGLEGSRMWVSSLQFHGCHQGRVAEAYWYRGPTLEVFVEGQIGARAMVASSLRSDALEGLAVMGDDSEWGKAALPPSEAALQRLLLTASMTPGQVHIRPDGVLVRWRGPGAISMPAPWLTQVFADLVDVVEAAEVRAPAEVREPTAAESTRGRRWAVPGGLWTMMIGLGVLSGGMMVLLAGMVLVLSALG